MKNAIIIVSAVVAVVVLGPKVRALLKLPETPTGFTVSGMLVGAVAGIIAYISMALLGVK